MRWSYFSSFILTLALILSLSPGDAFGDSDENQDVPYPGFQIGNTPPTSMGAGLQLGVPTGFSVKSYLSSNTAITGDLVWNLKTFAYANANVVYERPFVDTPLNVFAGPGVLVGPGGYKDDHDFTVGLHGMIGLNAFIGQFEPFVALTPIITLNVATQGYIGTTFGLRLYV